MLLVVVVVDPGPQPLAETFDERQGYLRKTAATASTRKRDIEHGDTPEHTARSR